MGRLRRTLSPKAYGAYPATAAQSPYQINGSYKNQVTARLVTAAHAGMDRSVEECPSFPSRQRGKMLKLIV